MSDFIQMKAKVYEPKRMKFPCWAQPKLNGVFAMRRDTKIISGDAKEWRREILAPIFDALEGLPEHVTLAGELYVHGWRLQQINGAIAVKRVAPNESSHKVIYNVYDLVKPSVAFALRYKRYKAIVGSLGPQTAIVPVPAYLCRTQQEADYWYYRFLKLRYEGAIYHLATDEGYECEKRSSNMLKRKFMDDAEYEIVDVTPGEGKHKGRLGALVCKLKSGKTFNVGTGFSDKEREDYWKNKPIGQLAKVEFDELSEENTPLRPRFIIIRDFE